MSLIGIFPSTAERERLSVYLRRPSFALVCSCLFPFSFWIIPFRDMHAYVCVCVQDPVLSVIYVEIDSSSLWLISLLKQLFRRSETLIWLSFPLWFITFCVLFKTKHEEDALCFLLDIFKVLFLHI